tara:strand:- start:341 stop:478 length:138 start_codon:yes stop_codon:yes gene_type:complete
MVMRRKRVTFEIVVAAAAAAVAILVIVVSLLLPQLIQLESVLSCL